MNNVAEITKLNAVNHNLTQLINYGNQFNFKYLYFLLIFKKKYIFNFMKRWIF